MTVYEASDIYAALHAREWLTGVGGILCPRQEYAKLFSQAPHEGRGATPPYTPCALPDPSGNSGASQDPTCKRAADADRNRRRRNSVNTGVWAATRVVFHYLRYDIASEVAGAWKNSGGLGGRVANLAHVLEPSVAHLGRERGSRRFQVRSGPIEVAKAGRPEGQGGVYASEDGPIELVRGGSAVGVHESRGTEASREYGPSELSAKRFTKKGPEADSAMVAPWGVRSAGQLDEIEHLCIATGTINDIDYQRKLSRKRYQNRRRLSDSLSGHSYIV